MADSNVRGRAITRGREVVTRRIADETLIVPVAGGVGDLDAIYTLNAVGARIWELLDGGTTSERIVQTIRDEFDVPADRAEGDVTEFLDTLEAAGLVVGI